MAVNKKLAATGGTSKRLTAEKPVKKATVSKTAYPKTKTPNKQTLPNELAPKTWKKTASNNAVAKKNAAANRAVNTRPAAKTVRRRAV